MTVKCIPESGKDYMVAMFTKEFRSINELTEFFDCSRRTVVRVLVERGIDPQLRKRIVKVKLAPMPSVEDLSGYPIMKVEMIEPQPWWKRAQAVLSRVFLG